MSQTGFPGIQPAMLEYFVGIALNNYREYFLSTHKDYEQNVKKPLYALAEELVPYALEIDDDMEQLPRRIVSRIRRDTRFTKDKSPYRSHMWLSFHPMSKPKWACFGLYYDISPDCSCYGGGFYDSDPARARWMRALLLRRQRELVQILTDPAFAAHYRILGEDYKRIEIPEELHPALRDLYRKKSFYVEHNDGLDPRISRPEYAQEIGDGMLLLKPLYQLLTNEYGDFAE